MAKDENSRMFTVVEMANMLGVTDRMVRNWIKDKGLPAQQMPGVQKLDARAVIAWFVDFRIAENGNSGNRRPNPGSEAHETPPETFDEAILRKTKAEADLKELQLARERGEVASISDVQRVLVGANKSIQTRILALSSALTPQLLGLDDRQRINLVLERYCHDVLTNMASIDAVREARTAKPDGEEE